MGVCIYPSVPAISSAPVQAGGVGTIAWNSTGTVGETKANGSGGS